MIVISAGTRNLRSYDAQLVFATQLAERGHDVCIDAASLPEGTRRSRTYEAASLLVDRADISPTAVFVLGADELDDPFLSTLWEYGLGSEVPVVATGRFEDQQAYLAAKAKLAFSLGREAEVIDLCQSQPRAMLPKAVNPLVAARAPRARPMGRTPVVTVALGSLETDEEALLPHLSRLNNRKEFRLQVIASGKQKEQIKSTAYRDLPVLHLTELSPVTFAHRSDVFVLFGQGIAGERMASFAINLMAAGGAVVDCTENRAIVETGAPALRGPESLMALENYLCGTVVKSLGQIGEQVAHSPWQRSIDIARLESAAGLPPPEPKAEPPHRKVVFFPTNGVGLGHAQRATVVAEALPTGTDVTFAAFPSCIPMILRRGFDCLPLVSRSDSHETPIANDILTYRRLQQVLYPGDRLVFDGGYVFDSVFRTIQEMDLSAAWIRRGLWPDSPSARIALDREHVFDRVIVPSEAFEELNDHYSFGNRIRIVGPIVKQAERSPQARATLRDRLQERFGRPFDKLVVSMLGGGVASDRAAHSQMLSALLAERPECLHLIVVWPNSTVSPTLHNWPNTRVVQTLEATALCLSADFVISAAGYNSVHEILYHRIPAIFIPQSAPYLDDQTRRARALEERGLCSTVEETDFLKLERALRDCLDGTAAESFRRALEAVELPEPGTESAARLIAQDWEAA
ncbi:glycosyltransferase [Tropicimonas marinistellae]|uniref:glycosyltransferase n=1 Tax=Tropicimonas marinistellae TaxID=1739787 RepID=UPI000835A91E|nr:glycosyltransferase [Tropicimonas marinistellae]